ncbi:MAG: tyrosine-protein phosphatase [Acidobacteriota bacterium]|nr:tyrosine-protein phosphatase [Acidobacteriota bacterium]
MKITVRYFSLLLIVAFANFAHAQKAFKNKDLPNFAQVNANLYRGGQPTEAGVKELAKMGVKTIVDLRGEEDIARAEEIWAQKAGVRFVNVSLSNWFEPKTADIEQILKEIDAPENQPVFVHCRRGADRTGTVLAVHRIRHDDWTAKQAIAEAKRYDFGWWQFWMKDYINDYYRDFVKQKQ